MSSRTDSHGPRSSRAGQWLSTLTDAGASSIRHIEEGPASPRGTQLDLVVTEM